VKHDEKYFAFQKMISEQCYTIDEGSEYSMGFYENADLTNGDFMQCY